MEKIHDSASNSFPIIDSFPVGIQVRSPSKQMLSIQLFAYRQTIMWERVPVPFT